MSEAEYSLQIRPMVLQDLKDIFYTVHQKIKAVDTSATYQGFTIEHVFGMETGKGEAAERPNILEVARLIDLSLVAEFEGTPCGFIVGRQTYLAERDILEGEIVVIGIHPDYRGKGIAAKLVNSLCDLFISRGVRVLRVGIDPLDHQLLSFFEGLDFSGQRLLYLTRELQLPKKPD